MGCPAGLQEAPPLGGSEEGGVAPICHEMLRHVVNEMHRYERVITYWPLFGPYIEAALCVVLRSIIGAVSRQCGMTRVRGAPADTAAGAGSAKSSPFKGNVNNRYSVASTGSEYRWVAGYGVERFLACCEGGTASACAVRGWKQQRCNGASSWRCFRFGS